MFTHSSSPLHTLVIGAFVLGALTACASAPRAERAAELPSLAFTHVNVVDVESGRVLPDQTVLIAGNRIQRVGPSSQVRVSSAAQVVEGGGKYLIPGLIDTHVHLWWEWWREYLPTDTSILGLYLANGITGIREAGTRGGERENIAARNAVNAGQLLGPNVYVSGMVNYRNVDRYQATGLADLLRIFVDLGVDGIKLWRLTLEEAQAVIEQAHRAGRPAYGHTFDFERAEVGDYTLKAVRAGADGVMHVEFFLPVGNAPLPEGIAGPPPQGNWQERTLRRKLLWLSPDEESMRTLIEAMVARGAWLEPTLITIDPVEAYPQYRDYLLVPVEEVLSGLPKFEGEDLTQVRQAQWKIGEFVRRFHEAGGLVLAGSDDMPAPGFALHEELQLLVEAGLSPLAALQAATRNASRALGWGDEIGTVENGKRANLLLLDANPLEDIRNTQQIRAVVANGRLLDRSALDALLHEAKHAAAAARAKFENRQK